MVVLATWFGAKVHLQKCSESSAQRSDCLVILFGSMEETAIYYEEHKNMYISPNYCRHVGRGTCKFAGRALCDAGLAPSIVNWDIAGRIFFICLFFVHSECHLQTRNSESKTGTRNTWFLIPNRFEYLKQSVMNMCVTIIMNSLKLNQRAAISIN